MTIQSVVRRKLLFLLLVAGLCVSGRSAAAAPFIYVVNAALDTNTVSVIDAATNTIIAIIPVEFGPTEIAITPDGRHAYVTGATGDLSVISTATNTVIDSVSTGCFHQDVAIAPDGRHAYVTDVCGRLTVIDLATNVVSASIQLAFFSTRSVVVSPDSTRAYVTTGNRNLFVIDTVTNTVVGSPMTLGTPNGALHGVAIAPDGKFVYVAVGGLDRTVLVIDTATSTVAATIPIVGGSPFNLGVTPDGRQLYVPNATPGFVAVIDTASRTVTANIVAGDFPSDVAFSPDGRYAYVSNGGSDTVSVIDTSTNVVVDSFPAGRFPQGIAVAAFTFTGTPGEPNCHGKSVSALASQFGGLDKAASALGFPSVQGLQASIRAFCQQ